MDFVTDVSNTMSRNGAIYPYVRALAAGYLGGSGVRRSDDYDVYLSYSFASKYFCEFLYSNIFTHEKNMYFRFALKQLLQIVTMDGGLI